MYKYYCFNAIAECGLANLSEDFVPVSDAKDADGILVRSAAQIGRASCRERV